MGDWVAGRPPYLHLGLFPWLSYSVGVWQITVSSCGRCVAGSAAKRNTKAMKNMLWEEYLRKKTISLKEILEEREIEERRKQLRKGQRERRKIRSINMADPKSSTSWRSHQKNTGSAK